jgi:DNA-binding NarL/FixJ family response regulator
MDLGIDKNLKIAEKYCFADGGCKKLKGKTDYNERLSICAGCTNYLNKIDLIDLLNHYRATSSSSSSSSSISSSPSIPRTGKGTEQSVTKIKKVLLLYHVDGLSITAIQNKLGLQFRTVKNIVNQSFKNESSNEKVRAVKEELEKDGLL